MKKFFFKWFLVVVFVLVLVQLGSFAAISQAEHDALMDLYNNTGGASWNNKTNWGGALGTENTWYGVVTDAGNTMVLYITLNNNNLQGTLPSTLNNLTNLTKLDLAYNWGGLTGDIPDLSALTNLNYFDLYWSSNLTSGAIPGWILNATNLTHLSLNHTNRNGTIPAGVSGLTNLQVLDLGDNYFTGDIPDLSALTNLNYFDLNGCYNLTSGAIPSWIFTLTKLQTLGLGGTNRTGIIPSGIGNLTNLYSLYLYSNQLTSIPPEIGNLTNLNYLYLYSNQLTSIPTEIGNLTKLNYLYLDNNQLTSIPTEIGNLTNLQTLQLGSNQLTSIPAEIGNLTNLNYLYLYDNQLTSIPIEIGNLPSLYYLYLNGNAIVGSVPSWISNLTNLHDGWGLDIRWNGLYSSDATLIAFLNQKQKGGDWQSTQTVAPTNVSAGSPTINSITLSWTPITYTADGGGYKVYYSTAAGGPYTLKGITSDKTISSMVVDGLSSGTEYYFVVKTRTNSHTHNPNTIESEYSAEVSATTVSCSTITLSPALLPNGTVGVAYSQTLTASGGTSPYTYSVTTGTLPTGLSLDGTTGIISGTPTTANTYNFTVTATDTNGCTGTSNY